MSTPGSGSSLSTLVWIVLVAAGLLVVVVLLAAVRPGVGPVAIAAITAAGTIFTAALGVLVARRSDGDRRR
jgi:hypothetical protein